MHLGIRTSGLNSLLDEYAPLRKQKTRFLLAGSAVLLALILTVCSQVLLETPAAVLFVLGVIGCTALFGLAAGLFTSVAAVLALDYLFIPPTFHFEADEAVLRLTIIFVALAACTHLVERRISARIRSHLRPPLGMHGTIDGVERGELYGWAFDADRPSEPINVTLFVNKHPVAQVAAIYHRPDVAETMECSGRHGFYIDLAPYFPVERSAWIDVQLPDGRSVNDAPSRMTIAAIARRPNRPTVIFMHIPKTAGTAFREAMTANFVQSEIAYQYPEPPGFLTPDLRALPLEQRRAFRIVVGHLQFGVHEALPQHSDYVTLVREPTARVLSQYAFLQHARPELMRDAKGRDLSLAEVLEQRLTADFDNTMVRCFSGADEREYPPGSLTSAVFDQALINLRNHFTFVGHQENSAEAYEWLRRHYGWDDALQLPSVNRRRSPASEAVSTSLLTAIRQRNSWDYLLYEEILKLFPLTRDAAPPPDRVAQHAGQA